MKPPYRGFFIAPMSFMNLHTEVALQSHIQSFSRLIGPLYTHTCTHMQIMVFFLHTLGVPQSPHAEEACKALKTSRNLHIEGPCKAPSGFMKPLFKEGFTKSFGMS